MISTDLANVADWIAGKAAKGEPLGPGVCATLASTLLDLSHQAAQLETRPIRLDSPEVRLGFHHQKMRERPDAS